MTNRSKVLCAVDFSDGGDQAVERAAQMAVELDADVELVHSYLPPQAGLASYAIGASTVVSVRVRQRAAAELQRLRARVSSHGVHASVCLREGRPEDVILRRAAETHPALIVMGHHSGKSLKRLLGGGVTRQVMRCAEAPVMSVDLN